MAHTKRNLFTGFASIFGTSVALAGVPSAKHQIEQRASGRGRAVSGGSQ